MSARLLDLAGFEVGRVALDDVVDPAGRGGRSHGEGHDRQGAGDDEKRSVPHGPNSWWTCWVGVGAPLPPEPAEDEVSAGGGAAAAATPNSCSCGGAVGATVGALTSTRVSVEASEPCVGCSSGGS